jgi:hypothetical protein
MRKLIIFLFFLTLLPQLNYAKKIVNMMGWTGYLTYTPDLVKKKNEIEVSCNVEISFDNYDSYDQMIKMVESSQTYDISIVSDTFFASVSDELTYKGSDLGLKASHDYNPVIREHYLKKYPANVGIFQLALSGFVYNPKYISEENISFQSIIKASTQRDVIFLDDPIEIANIIQNTYYPNESLPIGDKQIIRNINRFESDVIGKNIYFSDLHTPLDFSDKFAAHFIWSGEGLLIIEEAKKTKHEDLKYSTTPALDYISMDVLSVLNNKESTACVAQALLSKAYLGEMAKSYYYFSPYIEKIIRNDGEEYGILQKKFIQVLQHANKGTWLDNVVATNDELIYGRWQEIRGQINYQRPDDEEK